MIGASRWGIILAVLLASACRRDAIVPTRPPNPPRAQCDALCDQPCDRSGIAYAPSASVDPVGELAQQVLDPLIDRFDQCALAKTACTQCLARLRAAGIIR